MSDVILLRNRLIEQARAGDRHALERLLALSRPDLERYARRHCQSADVEEAIQDALWILYRKLGGLRSVVALSGWLFQVVRRLCLNYARRASRHDDLAAVPEADRQDRTAVDAEQRVILAAVIAALPAAYRDVLLLKDVAGHSIDDLATALRLSPEAAKSRLHRARMMVREALSLVRVAAPRTVA